MSSALHVRVAVPIFLCYCQLQKCLSNCCSCWLSLYEGIVWGMVGPILICVIATLATFLVAVRAAFTLKDQVVDSGNMRLVFPIFFEPTNS